MTLLTPTDSRYYIKPRAVSFAENDLGDVNRVYVSISSGTTIMVYVPEDDLIPYDEDKEYQKWVLTGYPTKLATSDAYYIYARLSRSDNRAIILFSTKKYKVDGSIEGAEGENNPSDQYFYIKLGNITATNGTTLRALTFDSGKLTTPDNSYTKEQADAQFVSYEGADERYLNSDGPDTALGLIQFLGGVALGESGNTHTVTKIHTSSSTADPSDSALATSAHVASRFLSKTEDDTAKGLITFEQGAEYGDYTPSATGACVKQDANGNWLIETDHLFVRKKATFTSVEIQDVHHVGGQLLLTSASAVIDLVTELDNGYKCYFRNVDSEGNTITNDWMVGDQAYCNTFNIQKQSDGKAENHFYWRKVTGKGTEGDFHYIILSKDESGEIEGRTFNDAPLEGDNVVQLGYQGSDDPDRQNAIIIAGAGQNSPYIYQFTGIDSFTLPEPETKIKPGDNLFTGVMNIQAGSTGAGNLTDIGDTITREAEKFAYGKYNLLRNTSFRGDYTSANLADDSEMGDASVYSQTLTYWSVANGDVSVQESEVAELKREIRLNGAIQQTLVSPLIAGESYVCSFRAKGAYVAFSVANIALRQSLTNEYKRYVLKFTAGNAGQVFSLVGNATVCDIQLERGNMASAWGLSVYDNGHELEYMQALDYLATAIKDGDTEILGGLLLTSIIKVGKYLDGKMEVNTAGISGIYNDDDDVAFWGGGTFEQAIKTVSRFKNNPNYTPTEEDWKNMANYVVTHGGDSFLRGYIYALGGVFRGTVYAKDGEFTGTVHAKDGDFTGTITALNVVHKFRELHVASNIELEINEQGASIHLIPEIQQWTVTLPPAENYKYRELSLYVSPIITRNSLTCDVVARENTGLYWRGRDEEYLDVTFKRYTLPYGSITKFISLQGNYGEWSWFIDSDTVIANLQIS